LAGRTFFCEHIRFTNAEHSGGNRRASVTTPNKSLERARGEKSARSTPQQPRREAQPLRLPREPDPQRQLARSRSHGEHIVIVGRGGVGDETYLPRVPLILHDFELLHAIHVPAQAIRHLFEP